MGKSILRDSMVSIALILSLRSYFLENGWMVSGDFFSDEIIDAVPMDSFQALVPFGFLYGWWRGFATLTGRVVGGGMQAVGLW